MIEKLFTTGVYGKTEDQFFGQLLENSIQAFCDIRQRRGVRGSQYSFVNSTYLKGALAARSITYCYFPELAPSREIRAAQHAVDQQQGILKRARQELGEVFQQRYVLEVLQQFDCHKFVRSFDSKITRIVLFCVENNAKACHRSLVADRIHKDLGITVEDL
jgi:uncharacterized protein (DUF488 family)